MSGTFSSFGGPVSTTFFIDSIADSPRSRLAAAVIWRRPSATVGAAPARETPWSILDGWSGGRDEDGREILYHRDRRVVRVLAREYPLPSDENALLLLIDEGIDGEAAPLVAVHSIAAAIHARPVIDRTLDKPARLELVSASMRAEQRRLTAIIESHPAVRAFRAEDPGGRR